MLLSDRDIKRELERGEPDISGITEDAIQPASVDVRLDNKFLVFNTRNYTYIDPSEDRMTLTDEVEVHSWETFIINSGEFILASTKEAVSLGASLAGRIEGKSSLGRLGLIIHSTAGFIDPGFTGQLTLELSNVSAFPILLRPSMKIAQLCFFRLSSPVEKPYGNDSLWSKYQNQQGPTRSASWMNFYKDEFGHVHSR